MLQENLEYYIALDYAIIIYVTYGNMQQGL